MAFAPHVEGDSMPLTRRELLQRAVRTAAALALPLPTLGCAGGDSSPDAGSEPAPEHPTHREPPPPGEDDARLHAWISVLREEGFDRSGVPLGRAAARVGELASGTPYEAHTLEEYLLAGGSPARTEPLTLSLTRFDCVSLVESCLAIARVAAQGRGTWEDYAREMERMRYRDGSRGGYASRLHYFSEWIDDNVRRGLARELGRELGGREDTRPLRFMTANAESYPALAHAEVMEGIRSMERSLDGRSRWVIPTERIPSVEGGIETGDIVAFATAIPGLDVSHAAFAYRDADGVLRVLHAPLSGGVVEITRTTVHEYVRRIRRSTGILLARPLTGAPTA
jgi:hypothetical protein